EQADRIYQQAIDLYEAVKKESPIRPKVRHELAKGLINRANLGRDPSADGKLVLRAREILAKLVEDFPHTPEYHYDLATACNGLAAAAFKRKDWTDAEHWLAESAKAWRKLLTSQNLPDNHAGLGMALGNLGRVALTRSDLRRALSAAAGSAVVVDENATD